MVVNRVHACPAYGDWEDDAESEPAGLSDGGLFDAGRLWDRMQTAAEDALTLARRDWQGLKRLRKAVGADLPYVEVPAFDRDVHELGSLARLSEYLVGASAQ
jgi:hypothetical protein